VLRTVLLAGVGLSLVAGMALAAEPASPPAAASKKPEAAATADPNAGVLFAPEKVDSEGSVNVEGKVVDYHAVAGTIIVHPRGWDDAAAREKAGAGADLADKSNPQAEASMFYAAYFKKGAPAADRPITFIYNGGPGSSTMWLHMGAFGPRRIVTADNGAHTPAAPYTVTNNAYSLLDVSDLVFIDAPGAGFSRIAGKDKEKAFYGVDADAYAFTQFIVGFLSQYGRWNSPKYLFGESYGTPRSAVLINNLETGQSVDFNGVILLSQILDFSLSVDGAENNPGSDQAYIVALPTYAASAWHHNLVGADRPADLTVFLKEVEHFAITDYALALQAGSELEPAKKQAIAERLAHYTGLPVSYVLRANLRITGGEFEKTLQANAGLTTGRLDTRFSGPDMDPLSKSADYDPQAAALSSAYVSGFNDYARRTLGYGQGKIFKPSINVFRSWDNAHTPPGANYTPRAMLNVMPDLASAMKYNPSLKVMLLGGYYDLATPYYEGWYEMHHLPMPDALQANISYRYYQSGHMVYAHEASLKALHDDVAAFIVKTDNVGAPSR